MRDFPGGPVDKTLHSQCRGQSSIPPVAIRRGEGAQMKRCRDTQCSFRGNPACRRTSGGRTKGVRYRFAIQGGTWVRVARGSTSFFSSHGRGIGPQDAPKDSQGLSRVAAGNPRFPRLVPVTSKKTSHLTLLTALFCVNMGWDLSRYNKAKQPLTPRNNLKEEN